MTLLELLQQPLNRAARGEFTLARSQAVNNFKLVHRLVEQVACILTPKLVEKNCWWIPCWTCYCYFKRTVARDHPRGAVTHVLPAKDG